MTMAENRGKSKVSQYSSERGNQSLNRIPVHRTPSTTDQRSVNHDNHEIVEKRNLRSNVFLVIKFAFVSGSSEAELNSVVHHCDFSWGFWVSFLGAVLFDR